MIFNGTRLAIARKRSLLTKKQLALRAQVTEHTVARAENGSHVPSQSTLDRLADVLGYPTEFFFGPDLDWPDDRITSFRSLTSMTSGLRDGALAAGALGFMVSDWVSTRFNLPVVDVPDLGGHIGDPERAAVQLRVKWSLGEKPISNMTQLLESKGVRVFALAENTTKVNAFSVWRKDVPFIYLNTYKSAESSRFDAAHELGHLVLHQDGAVTGREAEDQANRFASSFLMPAADILAHMKSVPSVKDLILAKRRWKVSVAALNHRLHSVGLTSEWIYRDLCVRISTEGYRMKEPQGIERETSSVWKKVLTSLWSEGTTHEEISRALSLPQGELATLLFGMISPSVAQKSDIRSNLSLVTE